MTDNPPNPPSRQNRNLIIPWLITACLFTLSIIIAIVTMVRGMAYARANQSALPSWYHSLLTLSQYGLFLSTLCILILVAISFRRAFKQK